jgi:hypothetical protein
MCLVKSWKPFAIGKVYEDFVVMAIEDCFNNAIRAVEVRLGVHVQNVLEETDIVSSMSLGQ